MNNNTALVMFAVIAAFGLATATLVVPLVPQADAQGCPTPGPNCRAFGQATAEANRPSDVPRGPP